MIGEKNITSTCTISNHVVYKDERPLFEDPNTDVAGFLLAVYHHFGMNYPKFYKMDNLSKLGWMAAEILLKDGFQGGIYPAESIGVVLSNSSSSLDTDIKYYETAKEFASPALFVYTLPNIVIGEICIRHRIKGENAFFISDTFDAEFIEQYVSNLMNNNIIQCCICGWVELLDDRYEAVLMLVENNTGYEHTFTTDNINKLYNGQINS